MKRFAGAGGDSDNEDEAKRKVNYKVATFGHYDKPIALPETLDFN